MTTPVLPQGHPDLIDSDTARRLLTSGDLARLAYTAADGTPRVFPMGFVWTGEEVVFATFAGAHKIGALRARPDVAITIDTAEAPPQVLLLRGRAVVTDVEGVVPEYALMQRRSYGDEAAEAVLAEIDVPGLRMARIAVRPTWVGVLDFTTRFPGGRSPEEFASRGRAS